MDNQPDPRSAKKAIILLRQLIDLYQVMQQGQVVIVN